MLALGPLAFANPWMLLGLVLLPAIWWLLKISPPVPKRVRFPAIRFLIGLTHEEKTPAHTPLWLLILRSVLAALVVLALADPLWNPAPKSFGTGPLMIVTDNGWAAAPYWRDRINTMDTLIAEARRNKRPVLIVGTAPTANAPNLNFESADDAAARLRSFVPLPIAPDRKALADRLLAVKHGFESSVQIVWLSDGLDYGHSETFAAALSKLSGKTTIELVEPRNDTLALALLPPASEGKDFIATIVRAIPETEGKSAITPKGAVRALSSEGAVLAVTPFAFAANQDRAQARFNLPAELRNRIGRLAISGEASSAAVTLIDERWRRRSVALVSGDPGDDAQPLLSELYYVERSLEPYAEIRRAASVTGGHTDIEQSLVNPPSVILLADVGTMIPRDHDAVETWVDNGGVLIRFAGPNLASEQSLLQAEGDTLTPVRLRSGGRSLDGALSWSHPQGLAPFESGSPFYGLAIPADVTVSRQLLAEPSLDITSHVWARLQDGTPLVTAAKRGKGWIVLFHTSANAEWSTLPLSGLFPEMLRRVVALSQGMGEATSNTRSSASLAPVHTLDGFGILALPPASATPIAVTEFDKGLVSPQHPPGYYGLSDAPRALNQMKAGLKLRTLPELQGITERHPFAESPETRLRPWALGLALVLIIADGIAALYVTGLFDAPVMRRRRKRATLLPALLIVAAVSAISFPQHVHAADSDAFDLQATTETHLAYVITGDDAADAISEEGLTGLTDSLRARTALEAGKPMGVDVAHDDLAFFPLLYWRITAAQPSLSAETLTRIAAYIKNGGMILFDTNDQNVSAANGAGPGADALRRLISSLDLPQLTPIPADHVLGKSFYLLQDFPGRWSGGQLWVEADDAGSGSGTARVNDGVSSIMVGSNDFAAAWARDSSGRPLYPCEPGGEQQREMAERFGINLVMYALTGNYKSDQVHVPALLERLGR